jgi:hypothetical protein
MELIGRKFRIDIKIKIGKYLKGEIISDLSNKKGIVK